MKITIDLATELIKCESYRDYIQVAIVHSTGKSMNYAAVARKLKFSSRAFVYELLQGRKAMTANSLNKFILALKLKGPFAQLLQYLVWLEEPKLALSAGVTEEKVRLKINDLRKRIAEKYVSAPLNNPDFISYDVFNVYASIGSETVGSTFSEVLQRTGLTESTVNSILHHFELAGFVYKKEDRFFTSKVNVDMKMLGDNIGFKQAYLEAIKKLSKRATQMEENKQDLFFHTAFSVRKEKLAEMQERLQEVILDFLDNEQDEDGDTVQKITLGFYR